MSKPLCFFTITALSFLCLRHSVAVNSSSCFPSAAGCGGVSVHYPFWVKSDSGQEYCGYPGFGLKCSDHGPPIISLPSDTYYVTEINYHTYTLTLVDMDVVNQSCPRARHNVSLGSFPLSFNYDLNVNLSFYFNCSVSNDYADLPPNQISCLKNEGSKKSYVVESPGLSDTYGLNIDCEEKVVVVVKKKEIRSDELVSGFGEAMNEGFVLDWRRATDCVNCEDSGGFCGYNQTNHQLCFCTDGSIATKSCRKGDISYKRKVIAGVVSAVVFSGAIVLLLLFTTNSCSKIKSIKSWRRVIGVCVTSEVDQNIEAFIRNHGVLALTRYKFADVKKMTNSFKRKLGQGGYGSVYKGKLLDGRPATIKLLKATEENGEDFINEVASISRTSHVNVVTLLGFCFEGKHKALIYEFMPNGSLDKFIHNKNKNSRRLTWEKLYQIAIGIARGLEYLHRGCNTQILHFDIKPHNILLDESFCPKISDFGLAKLCPKNKVSFQFQKQEER